MYCIVGLGNPGKQYQTTRHNAGFLVIDRLAETYGVAINQRDFQSRCGLWLYSGQKILLLKPQTFMNLSGEAVRAAVNFYKIPRERLLVIYDEMDLPLGSLRFRPNGSAGGHRGMGSIIEALGDQSIPRLRVGIGRPGSERPAVVDYVLTPFSTQERSVLDPMLDMAAKAAVSFVEHGAAYTMNHYNISPRPAAERIESGE